MKFSASDIQFAQKINFELVAKYFNALGENHEIILPPPPTPISATLQAKILSDGNWGYGFLKTDFIAEKLKKGEKPTRKILYCVVDTMAYPNHDALLSNNQFVPKKFCLDHTSDKTGIDGHGHGHHVAGTIMGKHPNGFPLGLAYVNNAPTEDLIMAQKGLNSNGSGAATWLVNAILHAANVWETEYKKLGYLLVYNFSWGGGSETPSISRAIEEVISKGAFVNAAAGNDGSGVVGWPAAHKEVISWAACDNTGRRANFSQYGTELEAIAPGVAIWSTFKDNNSYVSWDGTSMATPHGTAAMGHVLKWYPEIKNQADLMAFLSINAVDGGPVGKDIEYGYGFPMLDKLLSKTAPTPQPVAPPKEIEEPAIPLPGKRSTFRNLTLEIDATHSFLWKVQHPWNDKKSNSTIFNINKLPISEKDRLTNSKIYKKIYIKKVDFQTKTLLDYNEVLFFYSQYFDKFFNENGVFVKNGSDVHDICSYIANHLQSTLKITINTIQAVDEIGNKIIYTIK